MIVEITGPTGAGKSTLLQGIVAKLHQDGVATGAILDKAHNHCPDIPDHLANLETHNIRTDMSVVIGGLLYLVRRPSFLWFCLRQTQTIGNSCAERINLMRSVLRKAGIRSFLSQNRFKEKVIGVDEGLFHLAHNLLVSPHSLASPQTIDRFLKLCPTPDLLIITIDEPETLLENLKQRGNLSPRAKTPDELERFVQHASDLYTYITDSPERQDDSLIVTAPKFQTNEALNLCTDAINEWANKRR